MSVRKYASLEYARSHDHSVIDATTAKYCPLSARCHKESELCQFKQFDYWPRDEFRMSPSGSMPLLICRPRTISEGMRTWSAPAGG